MAFTCGFFNSQNGDRKYNAEQMASIFDGLIKDGVYDTVGDIFAVTPGTGMQVLVGSGRAWFDHTWNNNDAQYPLAITAADVSLPRYDAVVLETNHSDTVRTNRLRVLTGTPASNPAKPTMASSANVKQHPLAYIRVTAGATAITQSMIQVVVGTSECPFVTGIIETAQIDALFQQWNGEFDEWFDNLKAQLSDNVVANLQNQINQKVNKSDVATTADIEAGTSTTKWVSPKGLKDAGVDKVKDVVTNQLGYLICGLDTYIVETSNHSDFTENSILVDGDTIIDIGTTLKKDSSNTQFKIQIYDGNSGNILQTEVLGSPFYGSSEVNWITGPERYCSGHFGILFKQNYSGNPQYSGWYNRTTKRFVRSTGLNQCFNWGNYLRDCFSTKDYIGAWGSNSYYSGVKYIPYNSPAASPKNIDLPFVNNLNYELLGIHNNKMLFKKNNASTVTKIFFSLVNLDSNSFTADIASFSTENHSFSNKVMRLDYLYQDDTHVYCTYFENIGGTLRLCKSIIKIDIETGSSNFDAVTSSADNFFSTNEGLYQSYTYIGSYNGKAYAITENTSGRDTILFFDENELHISYVNSYTFTSSNGKVTYHYRKWNLDLPLCIGKFGYYNLITFTFYPFPYNYYKLNSSSGTAYGLLQPNNQTVMISNSQYYAYQNYTYNKPYMFLFKIRKDQYTVDRFTK